MRRRRLAAVGISVALLVAALLAVLLNEKPRGAADNNKPIHVGVLVPPNGSFCQRNNVVPADARQLRVWVSTAGRPGNPLSVEVRDAGRVVARGRAPGGYIDSPVTIPLNRQPGEWLHATVCVRSEGARPAAFMGDYAPAGQAPVGNLKAREADGPSGDIAAEVKGQPAQPVVARIDFRRGGSESWLQLAPTVFERASYGRPSFFGTLTPWVLIVAMGLAALGALVLVTRQVLR